MIYNHAIFSLCTMTGYLALVLSVSLFCKSIAEAKEWKRKYQADEPYHGLHFFLIAESWQDETK